MESMDFAAASPSAMQAMLALEKAVRDCSIEHSLIHLVKLRVSQINGCAYCMDMHAGEAMKDGETPGRLHTLVAWRETTWFTARERAALSWAEALTRIAAAPFRHEEFDMLKAHFSEQEIAELTLAVVAINGWNRIAVGFGRTPPE